jgi:hypothetical protein
MMTISVFCLVNVTQGKIKYKKVYFTITMYYCQTYILRK